MTKEKRKETIMIYVRGRVYVTLVFHHTGSVLINVLTYFNMDTQQILSPVILSFSSYSVLTINNKN